MDWVALITTLLTTVLPLIINKGPATSKPALLRRAANYKRISDNANASVEMALVASEAAELCICLAACETQADQTQLLASADQAFGAMRKAV